MPVGCDGLLALFVLGLFDGLDVSFRLCGGGVEGQRDEITGLVLQAHAGIPLEHVQDGGNVEGLLRRAPQDDVVG